MPRSASQQCTFWRECRGRRPDALHCKKNYGNIKRSKINIADIAAIETACFSSPWNPLALEAELDNECSHMLSAVKTAGRWATFAL